MTNCPKCGSLIKTVPAGVSKKNGKPYNAFQCCSSRECDWKPMKAGSASPSVSSGSNNDRVVTLLEEIKAILCKIAFPKVPTINVDADPVSEEEAPF